MSGTVAPSERLATPVAYAEVVPVQELAEIDYERRLTMGRLITVVSAHLELPDDYASKVDMARARPEVIEKGLYIPKEDWRSPRAKGLYAEVVFPSTEFLVVARNSMDIAKHVREKTDRANLTLADRDEAAAKVTRSGLHVLEGKMTDLEKLEEILAARRLMLLSLHNDLNSTWRAHYKAKNLEVKREEADKAIHDTVETSVRNRRDWKAVAVQGLHRAIKYHLYGPHDERNANWQTYIKLAGQHTRAKLKAIDAAKQACTQELEIAARL